MSFESFRRSYLGKKQTGVPRRFGMAVAMVIMTMYAMLFGVLKSFGTPPIAFVLIALFFTGVGVSQAVLFKGAIRGGRRLCPAPFLVYCSP